MRRSGPLLCPFLGGIGRRLRRIKLRHRNADQWLTSLFVDVTLFMLCSVSLIFREVGRTERQQRESLSGIKFSCASLAGNVLVGTVPISMNGGIW